MEKPLITYESTDAGDIERRLMPSMGFSATIRGALKILIGAIIKISGFALSDQIQSELVEGLSMLIGLGLDAWGLWQIYHARQRRGDIDWKGQRRRQVEIILGPTTRSVPPTAT